MYGKGGQTDRGFFNTPVVCEVTPEAINDAFQSLNRQLNDSVAPVVNKNFDKETGKPLKVLCGEMGPATVTCTAVLDWDSDISSGLEDSRVSQGTCVTYDDKYLMWTRQISGSQGVQHVHLLGDNLLPLSTTPTATEISSTYYNNLNGIVIPSPTEYAWATYRQAAKELIFSSYAGSTITIRGGVNTPVEVASLAAGIWTSDDYLILTTGHTTDLVYIFDVSDLDNPTLEHTIPASGSQILSAKTIQINRAESIFYIGGNGGVEAYSWSAHTSAPTVGEAYTTGGHGFDSLAWSEDDRWIFGALITSVTNLAYYTIRIGEADPTTLSIIQNGSITGTYLDDEAFRAVQSLWNTDETAVAALSIKNGVQTKLYVFNLTDLSDVTVEETVPSLGSTFQTQMPYVHLSADKVQHGNIWHNPGVDVQIEHWSPATIAFRIPCQLQLGQIKFTLEDSPCADIRVVTGVPVGHGIISNWNSDFLDSQHGVYYLDSANFTGTKWDDLTDGNETTLHIHPLVVDSTATDLTLTPAYQQVDVDTAATSVDITLPAADAQAGRHYWIRKAAAANVVNIIPNGSDTVAEGAGLTIVFKGDCPHLVSDGVSDWRIV